MNFAAQYAVMVTSVMAAITAVLRVAVLATKKTTALPVKVVIAKLHLVRIAMISAADAITSGAKIVTCVSVVQLTQTSIVVIAKPVQ